MGQGTSRVLRGEKAAGDKGLWAGLSKLTFLLGYSLQSNAECQGQGWGVRWAGALWLQASGISLLCFGYFFFIFLVL